jgi:hypothetical protein
MCYIIVIAQSIDKINGINIIYFLSNHQKLIYNIILTILRLDVLYNNTLIAFEKQYQRILTNINSYLYEYMKIQMFASNQVHGLKQEICYVLFQM